MACCLMGPNQLQLLSLSSSHCPITGQGEFPPASSWVPSTPGVLGSFLAGTGRTHQVILSMLCPRLGTNQLSGKPWSLLVTNNIPRPQSGIHTNISNSNSERFFTLTYSFCATSVSPFFRIKSPSLKDAGCIGLQGPIIGHLRLLYHVHDGLRTTTLMWTPSG